MCNPAAFMALAAIGSTAATIDSNRQAKEDAREQRDMLRNSEQERKAAADRAAQDAVFARTDQMRRQRLSTLATGAGAASGGLGGGSMSTLSYGARTLGG